MTQQSNDSHSSEQDIADDFRESIKKVMNGESLDLTPEAQALADQLMADVEEILAQRQAEGELPPESAGDGATGNVVRKSVDRAQAVAPPLTSGIAASTQEGCNIERRERADTRGDELVKQLTKLAPRCAAAMAADHARAYFESSMRREAEFIAKLQDKLRSESTLSSTDLDLSFDIANRFSKILTDVFAQILGGVDRVERRKLLVELTFGTACGTVKAVRVADAKRVAP